MSSTTTTLPDYAITSEKLSGMTLADVKRYIGTQARFMAETDTRVANATDRAAYATHAAYHAGYIGGSSPVVTSEEYVKQFGKSSKSLVTGWKTLGHALVVVGLDPTDPTGVYSRMRNANAYGQKQVKDAVYADGATAESIAEVLDLFVGPDGKRLRKSNGGRPNDGTDTTTTEGDLPTGKALVEFVAKQVREFMGSSVALDADDWQTVEEGMRAFLDAENARRSEALKVA